MSDSIKLSPKHGVNPCIPICFWCGKEKNEIAMLGKIDKEDSEAPRKLILNYEPCDECKKLIGEGIHVIGVQPTPVVKNMMPISTNPEMYPTGSFFVATPQWTQAVLIQNGQEQIVEDVLKKQVLLMPEEIVAQIIDEASEVPDAPVSTDFMEDTDNEDN
jgi:primase-polymerase (primpol)-like protein